VREDERALDALTLLASGEVALKGRMPWSSNATFLAEVTGEAGTTLAVYKPHRGERPLWDFPDGLYRREAAAWVLSDALGWGIVPPTIVRDGPLGIGSLQLFVEADFEQHYFTLYEDEAHHPALRTICAFDLVANNTDRKGGHCLLGADGRIYAIDNGLCFHPEPKVRTVIWEFATEAVPAPLLADLAAFAAAPPEALFEHLTVTEVRAAVRRAEALVAAGRFPLADPDERCYPWPLV
jgi:uncharacterized repeat protein (TIGR03843 family)